MLPLRLILTLDIKKFCDRCGVIVTEFAYLFSSYLKRTSVGVLCSGDEVQKHGTPALRSSYSRARGSQMRSLREGIGGDFEGYFMEKMSMICGEIC